MSNKTVRLAGAASVKESADQIKRDFKKLVEEDLGGKKAHIVHVDGKSLAQFHDQTKSVKKRLAIIVSSPYLPSDQVLGVTITPSNSGKDQRVEVIKVLKDWKFEPYVLGLGFDTTSGNTGWRKGSVVLI